MVERKDVNALMHIYRAGRSFAVKPEFAASIGLQAAAWAWCAMRRRTASNTPSKKLQRARDFFRLHP